MFTLSVALCKGVCMHPCQITGYDNGDEEHTKTVGQAIINHVVPASSIRIYIGVLILDIKENSTGNCRVIQLVKHFLRGCPS